MNLRPQRISNLTQLLNQANSVKEIKNSKTNQDQTMNEQTWKIILKSAARALQVAGASYETPRFKKRSVEILKP